MQVIMATAATLISTLSFQLRSTHIIQVRQLHDWWVFCCLMSKCHCWKEQHMKCCLIYTALFVPSTYRKRVTDM